MSLSWLDSSFRIGTTGQRCHHWAQSWWSNVKVNVWSQTGNSWSKITCSSRWTSTDILDIFDIPSIDNVDKLPMSALLCTICNWSGNHDAHQRGARCWRWQWLSKNLRPEWGKKGGQRYQCEQMWFLSCGCRKRKDSPGAASNHLLGSQTAGEVHRMWIFL